MTILTRVYTAALAVAIVAGGAALAPVSAASLGFGQFLGSWSGNNPNDPDELEALIRAAYPGTSPFATLGLTPPGIPGDIYTNQLTSIGRVEVEEGSGSSLGGEIVTYTGTQQKLDDGEPEVPTEWIGGT